MLLWFAVGAAVIVAEVFQSPMVDFRVVAAAAVMPLLEGFLGGPRLAHTLLFSVGLLALVMAVTQGRRLIRRRLLGIPIGLMLHLVLDFTWADQALLWWPAFGLDFPEGQIGPLERPLAVGLLLEVAAVGVGWWAYRRYELDDDDNRRRLVSTGQLSRGVF